MNLKKVGWQVLLVRVKAGREEEVAGCFSRKRKKMALSEEGLLFFKLFQDYDLAILWQTNSEKDAVQIPTEILTFIISISGYFLFETDKGGIAESIAYLRKKKKAFALSFVKISPYYTRKLGLIAQQRFQEEFPCEGRAGSLTGDNFTAFLGHLGWFELGAIIAGNNFEEIYDDTSRIREFAPLSLVKSNAVTKNVPFIQRSFSIFGVHFDDYVKPRVDESYSKTRNPAFFIDLDIVTSYGLLRSLRGKNYFGDGASLLKVPGKYDVGYSKLQIGVGRYLEGLKKIRIDHAPEVSETRTRLLGQHGNDRYADTQVIEWQKAACDGFDGTCCEARCQPVEDVKKIIVEIESSLHARTSSARKCSDEYDVAIRRLGKSLRMFLVSYASPDLTCSLSDLAPSLHHFHSRLGLNKLLPEIEAIADIHQFRKQFETAIKQRVEGSFQTLYHDSRGTFEEVYNVQAIQGATKTYIDFIQGVIPLPPLCSSSELGALVFSPTQKTDYVRGGFIRLRWDGLFDFLSHTDRLFFVAHEVGHLHYECSDAPARHLMDRFERRESDANYNPIESQKIEWKRFKAACSKVHMEAFADSFQYLALRRDHPANESEFFNLYLANYLNGAVGEMIKSAPNSNKSKEYYTRLATVRIVSYISEHFSNPGAPTVTYNNIVSFFTPDKYVECIQTLQDLIRNHLLSTSVVLQHLKKKSHAFYDPKMQICITSPILKYFSTFHSPLFRHIIALDGTDDSKDRFPVDKVMKKPGSLWEGLGFIVQLYDRKKGSRKGGVMTKTGDAVKGAEGAAEGPQNDIVVERFKRVAGGDVTIDPDDKDGIPFSREAGEHLLQEVASKRKSPWLMKMLKDEFF